MDDHGRQDDRREETPPVDQWLPRILRLAGRRRSVPVERAARIRGVVHHRWRRSVQARRRRRVVRRMTWTAAAAVAVLALFASTARKIGIGPWNTAVAVASVEVIVSDAHVANTKKSPARLSGSLLHLGSELFPGDRIETGGEGRIALRLTTGHSVRLDALTRLAVLSPTELQLERGAVYVDSGPGDSAVEAIAVHTP